MGLHSRYFGFCSDYIDPVTQGAITFDLNSFVLRLLLFDKLILRTLGLKEVPFLIETFGYEGFTYLLKTDHLGMTGDSIVFGQRGNPQKDNLFNYSSQLVLYNKSLALSEDLNSLRSINGLDEKRFIKLKGTIVNSLFFFDEEEAGKMSNQQYQCDLDNTSEFVKNTVAKTIKNNLGVKLESCDFTLKMEKQHNSSYCANTNLSKILGLSDEKIYTLIMYSLQKISGFNSLIEEMKIHNAITEISENELPDFDEKMNYLVSLVPKSDELRMQRIIEISDLGGLDPLNTRIDVEDLINAKNSNEFLEFKKWLSCVDSYSNQEIKEILESVKHKIAGIMGGKSGRVMRFLLNNVIGQIPMLGPLMGPVVGAIDTFVIEKLISKSGPITFIKKTYPSMFKKA